MSNFIAKIRVKETGKEHLASFFDDVYVVLKGNKEIEYKESEVELLTD